MNLTSLLVLRLYSFFLLLLLALAFSCGQKKQEIVEKTWSGGAHLTNVEHWYQQTGHPNVSAHKTQEINSNILNPCANKDGPALKSTIANEEIALTTDAEGSLVIKNTTSFCVKSITLTSAEKIYRLGTHSLKQLIDDILTTRQAQTQEEIITAIWQWSAQNFASFCSWNSPYVQTRKKNNLLNNIYSYSFGCCSDLNIPLLLNLMATSGIKTYHLRSPYHVSVQAEDMENHEYYYVDAAHDVMRKGYILDFPPDDYYRQLFSDENLSVYNDLPPQKVTNIINPQIVFHFAPNDELTFTNDLVKNRRIVARLKDYADILSYKHNTKRGTATLNLNAHVKSAYSIGEISCLEYDLNFPYILLSANLSQILPTTTAWMANKDVTEVPDPSLGQDAPRPQVAWPDDEKLTQISYLNFPAWGRHQINIHLCDTWKNLQEISPKIFLEFQYNAFLFPRMESISSVTYEEKD